MRLIWVIRGTHQSATMLVCMPARCSFSNIIVHSRMSLVTPPNRLKLLQTCDQWHSSRVSYILHVRTLYDVQTPKVRPLMVPVAA
jgi:hypothetical protein